MKEDPGVKGHVNPPKVPREGRVFKWHDKLSWNLILDDYVSESPILVLETSSMYEPKYRVETVDYSPWVGET